VGSLSPRISPRPGAATQNALASSDTPLILLPYERSYNAAHVPLRIRIVLAGAIGCVLLIALGRVTQSWLDVSEAYPWKAAVAFAAMMAAAIAIVDAHPFPRLGPANRVTIIRAFLVAIAAGLIGEPETPGLAPAAVAAGTVVALLDGVDGWLARRSRMASAFGGRFDMETDALLIMVLSVLVWQHDKAGAWVLAAGLLRYAFVAAGWLLPWMAGDLTSTRRAKTVAVLSVVGLSLSLAPLVARPLSARVAAVTLAFLAWSFAVDVRRLWRQRN